MTGPSGRRFSWAMSDAADFARYENGLVLYQGEVAADTPPSPGLAGKLLLLIRLAREQDDHTIAAALGDVLAGLQRRIQPFPPLQAAAAGTIANDP
ncbi:MAG: hypothetical protein ACP5NP_16200 [Acetobacteraceae bacterium]